MSNSAFDRIWLYSYTHLLSSTNCSFTAQIRATEFHYATAGDITIYTWTESQIKHGQLGAVDFMNSTLEAPMMPEVRYVACWTEDDGVHSCGCHHPTIAAALACLTPDGRTFIRAWNNGVLRSLSDDELRTFTRESMLRALTHRRITITVRYGDNHGCEEAHALPQETPKV
jgi:hypothetical protein